MAYHVVFDVATAGYREWFVIVFGLMFVALGAMLVFAPALMQKLLPDGVQGTARVIFSWFFFLFAILFTVLVAATTISQHLRLRDASLRNECTLISGAVTNFVPRPTGRNTTETFTVDGVQFEYSDTRSTGGFNQSERRRGPIREGLPVRICYVDYGTSYNGNVIVRLEVADER